MITTEISRAELALSLWSSGIGYGETIALTTSTAVACVDGWPISPVFNPDFDGPPAPPGEDEASAPPQG